MATKNKGFTKRLGEIIKSDFKNRNDFANYVSFPMGFLQEKR